MKRIFLKFIILVLLYLPSMLTFAEEAFTFDPMHTYVLWHINTLLPGLSDEVKINIEAEAYK